MHKLFGKKMLSIKWEFQIVGLRKEYRFFFRRDPFNKSIIEFMFFLCHFAPGVEPYGERDWFIGQCKILL